MSRRRKTHEHTCACMSTFLLRDRSWDKGRGPNELNSSFLHLEAVFSTSQAEPLSFKHQLPLPQEALLPQERSARMKSKGRGLLKEWGRLGHGYRPFHETQLLTCVKERKCQAAGRDVYPLIPGPNAAEGSAFLLSTRVQSEHLAWVLGH